MCVGYGRRVNNANVFLVSAAVLFWAGFITFILRMSVGPPQDESIDHMDYNDVMY